MNQNLWGPHLWFFLHTISFNYPISPTEKDKQVYGDFFTNLKDIIPCNWCRKNYKRNLRESPIRLDSRQALAYWLIDVHNEVNGREGKRPYTYHEIIEKYSKLLDTQITLTENDAPDPINRDKHSLWEKIRIILTTERALAIIGICLVIIFFLVFYRASGGGGWFGRRR